MLSVLLLIVLLTVTVLSAFSSAAETPEEAESASTAELLTAADLDGTCAVLNYVDNEQFFSVGHVQRLPEEEELDTYVFRNLDGTNSVYYMDENVKFIDENGAVQEKDTTLSLQDGYYTAAKNEFDLSIGAKPESGVLLAYEEYTVQMLPIRPDLIETDLLLSAATLLENNAVTYPHFYGEGMSLRYTPMLSGVKEDIILSEYTGLNEFPFLLYTDGLTLFSDEKGYYLAQEEGLETRIRLGNVVVYDAVGRPDDGTMTVQTVKPGNIYAITLSASISFLTAEDTVYPVTIDPVLRIQDTESSTGLIEDAVLFDNRPNKNYGDYKYLSIGKVDDTYGFGSVLMGFPGLNSNAVYNSLNAAQIVSAYLYVRDSTGNDAYYVQAFPVEAGETWLESTVTFSSQPDINTRKDYGAQIGTSSEWSRFNLTTLAQAWKLGIYEESGGIHLRQPPSSGYPKKAPYSSEYSDTSYRPYLIISYDTKRGTISTVKLDVQYDHAYLNRHPNAVERIKSELATLKKYLLDNFCIRLVYTGPTLFTSLSDTCSTTYTASCNHGTCANSTYNAFQEYHHTNAYNNLYALDMPDTAQTLRIAYLGRTVCLYENGDCASVDCGLKGLAAPSRGIAIIAEHDDAAGQTWKETSTLVHEFFHLYGTIDHYEQLAYYYGPKYGDYCIYGLYAYISSTLEDIRKDFLLCGECKLSIFLNIRKYNHSA